MRWKGRRQSTNVEDRRGVPGAAVAGGGLGLGGLLVIGLVWLLGGNVQQAANVVQRQGGAGGAAPAGVEAGRDDETREFMAVVLADTEDVWGALFPQEYGREYRKPKMVLFDQGAVRSGCGVVPAGAGPFYCPADQTVNINPSFFTELRERFGAPGDFAAAYVVAHEVGHHVQNLLGFSDLVNEVRARGDEGETNRASVRLELQADYLAGCWAHHGQKQKRFLEEGDIEEALNAAAKIGDDALQRQATGTVNPEGFTHGTSAQRSKYFRLGFETGDLSRLEYFFKVPYDRL